MKTETTTEKPRRSSYDKSKYAERRSTEVRLNFWVDGETSNQIEKMVAESGLERQAWLKRAIQTAIQLQLLDAQLTEGTIKGGFGAVGGSRSGSAGPAPRQEAPKSRKPRKSGKAAQ